MQISDEKVEQYVNLYFKKYGKNIDKAQARIELSALVCILEATYKYINKNNYEWDRKIFNPKGDIL